MIVVERPIAKGEQLFDSYNKGHLETPGSNRRIDLIFQYGIICNCTACKLDYPLKGQLKIQVGLAPLPNLGSYPDLGTDALKAALARYNKYMQKHDCFYPCAQLDQVAEEWEVLQRSLLDGQMWERHEVFEKYSRELQP